MPCTVYVSDEKRIGKLKTEIKTILRNSKRQLKYIQHIMKNDDLRIFPLS